MTRMIRCALALIFVANSITLAQQNDLRPDEKYKKGHSIHGAAFDTGPRQKPWAMEGIGKVHFPITTSNPEAQKWFDQGMALIHSFWFYEAERAFRWVLKLDPECAMGYWGLAMAVEDDSRVAPLIKEAAKRKQKVSERERMYIEAWEARQPTDLPKEAGGNETTYQQRNSRFQRLLEQIVLKYPDDIEAKAFLGLQFMGDSNRYGTELILQQVIARDPLHPGAHHYRIHNWDGKDGKQALDSCALYGKIAPQIGHAQHMPGHIYSGVGMWQEGAISMDAATRVERQYMRQRLTLPFNTWNYAHNQNYLCYIQEQLGMAEAAINGARQVLAAPLDPQYNNPNEYGAHWQGVIAMMRALIKFERWKALLDPNTFYWRDSARDKMYKAYCEAQAHIGLGDIEKAAKSFASHAALKGEIEKPENKWLEQTYTIQGLEIKAMLALAKGETLTGVTLLGEAAKREFEQRERQNDPPSYPVPIYNTLGRVYLAEKSPALAVEAFEKTLELVRNDGFALSGLVEAYSLLGEKEKAREAYARLLYVWSDADAGLRWIEKAKSFGLSAEPKDTSPGPQRNYKKTVLDHLGPNVWEPYEAPELAALDSEGRKVTLADFKGKNVLLIFYLGEECPHCLLQLREVAKRYKELAGMDTEVLAVSSDKPEENAESLKKGDIPFKLLSDTSLENAKRYKSFDDFEEIALHSTILIDRRGRVHWARTGGDPFMDFDFLSKEIQRLNQMSG
ncbi:MAG TPA: redoxin domain-containing protein, partial [Blastocatellia bacterium]